MQELTFHEMFSDTLGVQQIVIPNIQRDYAQGRLNQDTVRVRDNFLKALHDAICNDGICLDFVYGDVTNKVLTLLDGQQRLTTLFLLYWYAAKKCSIDPEKYDFLKQFSYQTRYSTREFCRTLIEFNPKFDSELKISDQIKDQAWFPLSWNDDPSIKSMLVMIDEIARRFSDVNHLWNCLVDEKKIKFYFLKISDMGATDELYIKLNSRGKQLTPFEHFKAEFEKQIKSIDTQKAATIEHKIDVDWTDFLWKYRDESNLTDKLFLNYFKFICDVICYESGDSRKGRRYDEFDLIEKYFSSECPSSEKHLDFIEKAFDVWTNEEDQTLFEKFLSSSSDSSKVVAPYINDVNLLKDCLFNYGPDFSYAKIILLYAFLQYALNISKINENVFSERIRIVNNLIRNSPDGIRDSDINTIPTILQQTKSIILNGVILNNEDIKYETKRNFNQFQIKEELEKLSWRNQNPDKIDTLNRLENHEILYGQISVVGLENYHLFDCFADLFNCDYDKITCALLTFGDYSRCENNYWKRTQLGSTTVSSWQILFHKSSADSFEETKNCLVRMLNYLQNYLGNNPDKVLDELLGDIIENYKDSCEEKSEFDWRYYFVKYPEFRPGKYGRYLNYRGFYCLEALWTMTRVSSNSYIPFLKIVEPENVDKDRYGEWAKIGNSHYLRCVPDGFEFTDKEDNSPDLKPIYCIKVHQNENHIDTEERVEKYKNESDSIKEKIKRLEAVAEEATN